MTSQNLAMGKICSYQKKTSIQKHAGRKSRSLVGACDSFVRRVNLVASLFLVGRAHWFAWIRQKKKERKKRWPRAQRYRAFSPFSCARTRPMQQVQLLRMLQHRLRECSSRSPSLQTRPRFLTLTVCSLVESDQLWFQRRRRTGEAARNRTVPMIARGG